MADGTTYTPSDVLAGILDLQARYKATLTALVAPLLNGATGGTANPDGSGGAGPWYQVPDLNGALHPVLSVSLSEANVLEALALNPPPSSANGAGGTWPFLIRVDSGGVLEVGRYIDFHIHSADSIDYDLRLYLGDDGTLLLSNSGIGVPGRATVGDFISLGNVAISGSNGGALKLQNSQAPLNEKDWDITVDAGGNLIIYAVSEANDSSSFALQIGRQGVGVYDIRCFTHLIASSDGGPALGLPGNRWSELFAVNGSIQTSDEREKTIIGSLTAAELRVARRLAQDVTIYQWNSAIAFKIVAKARKHIGWIAQKVKAEFEAEGLDGTAYGILGYDKWDEKPAIPAQDAKPATAEQREERDKDGKVVKPYVAPVPASPATPEVQAVAAGDRWNVRPDELKAFIIAGQEAAIQDQERRLAALEAQLQSKQ